MYQLSARGPSLLIPSAYEQLCRSSNDQTDVGSRSSGNHAAGGPGDDESGVLNSGVTDHNIASKQ